MTLEVLVGCPIRGRDWIIEQWFQRVEFAAYKAQVKLRYIFVGEPEDPTWPIVSELCRGMDRPVCLVRADDDTSTDSRRNWGMEPGRLEHMTVVRNALLAQVRVFHPEMFLSIDSDVLLHEDALGNLIQTLGSRPEKGPYGAVGGRMYMHSEGIDHPSWANYLPAGGLDRTDSEGQFPVDIIMGIKLMAEPAYNVDYEHHIQGEDIGWSLACRRAGIRLGWDGRVISKHVMSREALEVVDARVGY